MKTAQVTSSRFGRSRPLLFTSAILVTLVILSTGASAQSGPVVRIDTGKVRGIELGGAQAFLGIPYAAPPVGDLRWQPPAPAESWSGIRDATEHANSCPQLEGYNGPTVTTEDCLYLDVWRPTHVPGQKKLPVLFWIHGGGYVDGGASQHDAREMAEKTGTIVVAINYRLGAFGFLGLPALTAESSDSSSGNYGLMDMQAALQWVQRNIAAFGGDPKKVTIAGESAGGMAVCANLASPTVEGLFHGAIIQSGGGCGAVTLAEAEATGTRLAEAVSCDPSDVSCLRSKDVMTLLTTWNAVGPHMGPNVSGAVLPVNPPKAIASGDYNRVPVMIGNTHDEFRMVTLGFVEWTPEGPVMTQESFEFWMGIFYGPLAGDVIAEYSGEEPIDAFADAWFTDPGFTCPARRLANDLDETTRVYYYEFNDQNAPQEAITPGFEWGAFHASELQYLFDFTLLDGSIKYIEPKTPEQEVLSDQMMGYWASFTHNGSPNIPYAAPWPQYHDQTERALSLQPGGNTVITDFAIDHHCDFWDSVAP